RAIVVESVCASSRIRHEEEAVTLAAKGRERLLGQEPHVANIAPGVDGLSPIGEHADRVVVAFENADLEMLSLTHGQLRVNETCHDHGVVRYVRLHDLLHEGTLALHRVHIREDESSADLRRPDLVEIY